jgi:hypothetical protein
MVLANPIYKVFKLSTRMQVQIVALKCRRKEKARKGGAGAQYAVHIDMH